MSEATQQNAPPRSLEALRARAPEELRAIGKMPAKAAGTSIRAFFEANKPSLTDLVQGYVTPDRLLGVALNAIRQTPKLQECTVASLFGAIVQCAVMRLEPNTFDGHCYLIPRKKNVPVKDENGNIVKQNGRWVTVDVHEVNVQIGYKGRIELAYRSPKVKSLFTSIIHANDKYRIVEGTEQRIEHEPNLDSNRGAPIAYYAVAELTTGGRVFDWMSVKDIERVRDNFSEGYARAAENRQNALATLENSKDAREQRRARLDLEKAEDNPWIRDFDQMARKTVLNRLDPYLPSTPESSLARALDQRDSTMRSQDLGGVIDGTAMSFDDGDEPHDADNATAAAPPQIEQEQSVRQTVELPQHAELRRQVSEELAANDMRMAEQEKQPAKRAPKARPPTQEETPSPTVDKPGEKEDQDLKRAENMVKDLEAVGHFHEYEALIRMHARTWNRFTHERPDLAGMIQAANAAAAARFKARPDEEPPPVAEFPGDRP